MACPASILFFSFALVDFMTGTVSCSVSIFNATWDWCLQTFSSTAVYAKLGTAAIRPSGVKISMNAIRIHATWQPNHAKIWMAHSGESSEIESVPWMTSSTIYNNIQNFRCQCVEGFVNVSGSCENRNECEDSTNPCGSLETCVDNFGSYRFVNRNYVWISYKPLQ